MMNTLKNNVQLIGNVGQEPNITTLENGKIVARLSLATNEHYKTTNQEKQTTTYWHTLIAWGKPAKLIQNYVSKGQEIAISGKLTSRSYETNNGEKRYITEVLIQEILLLGSEKKSPQKPPVKKVRTKKRSA